MGEFLPPVIAVLGANIGQFSAKMGQAKAEMAGTTGAMGRLSAIGKTALLGLGVAAAVIGVASIHMAMNFDRAMELVHTQAGASQAEVDQLKNKVLALAGPTATAPQKLADGLYHIESAGFRGNVALGMLTDAAKGAQIGMGDLESVTQAMIGTMAAGLPDVHGSADAMAYLNTIVGVGDMRMGKLAASIATGVLPTFKTAGLGMRDFGAALATLTDNVTPADEAATRLRMTVSLMAAPSKKATKDLASIGISALGLANTMRSKGLLGAVELLRHHLEATFGPNVWKQKSSAASQAMKVLSGAFGGGRTSGSLMTLLQEVDRLRSKYEALGTSQTRAQKYQEAWKKTQQQFAFQLQQLEATLQALGIRLGVVLIPYVQKFAHYLMVATQFVEKHKAVAVALAAILGTVLLAGIYAVTSAIIAMTVAMLADPLTWILVGVVALAVGIYELAKHWHAVWGAIKDVAVTVWRYLSGFFSRAWHDVVDPLVRGWRFLETATVAVWDRIAGFFKKWWPLLLVIFMFPIAVLLAVWNHFHTQIETVARAVWGRISAFFKTAWLGIKVVAGAAWAAIYQTVVKPVQQLWDFLSGIFTKVAHLVGDQLHRAWEAAKAVAGLFLDVGKAIVQGIAKGVEQMGSVAVHAVTGLAGNMLKGAKSFLGIHSPSRVFHDVGKNIAEGLAKGLDEHSSKAYNAALAMAKKVVAGYLEGRKGHKHHLTKTEQDAALKWIETWGKRLHDTHIREIDAAHKHAVELAKKHAAELERKRRDAARVGQAHSRAQAATLLVGHEISMTAALRALAADGDRPIQVHLDGAELYRSTQKTALRRQHRNINNGLSK